MPALLSRTDRGMPPALPEASVAETVSSVRNSEIAVAPRQDAACQQHFRGEPPANPFQLARYHQFFTDRTVIHGGNHDLHSATMILIQAAASQEHCDSNHVD